MDDLVTWLRAQLDDDARMLTSLDGTARNGIEFEAGWEVLAYVERGLAEVDAKRRIMAIHHPKKFEGMGGLPQICDGCGYGGICDDPITEDINDCPILRLLALPYADRPGYRQDWAPSASA